MTKNIFGNNRGLAKVWAIVLICLALAASAGIGTFLGLCMPGLNFKNNVRQVFVPPFGGKTVIRLLVLGEDNTGIKNSNENRGLSDAIMLVNLNLETKQVSVLSIPRDTKVDLGGYGGDCKINAAYKVGGPMLTEMVVEKLTGVKPDYFVKTDVGGFKKTVDIVGGVDIDVEKNMHYVDHWGHLYINLKKGNRHLDGERAMGYVRFRHDAMGDIWRVQRQQKFMVALAKKATEPGNWTKLPQIMRSVKQNVETDLTMKDLLELAKLPEKVDMTKAKMETFPGVPQNIHGLSYWIADAEKASPIIQELFFTSTVPGLPKIEVLNGSGISGGANRVAEAFKRQGYEVTTIGNADAFNYTSSEVISHKKDLQGLDQIAGVVNSTAITFKESPGTAADVTVIVGKDCALLSASGRID